MSISDVRVGPGQPDAGSGTATSLDGVRRIDVCFSSAGLLCEGWLYRPPGRGPFPCVVMAHGIGGVRGAGLPKFARRFAAGGIAVLVFDYRYLGTSEGQPRGLIDIRCQRADLRAALDFVGSRADVDGARIILWGTSFGAGHVLATVARGVGIAAAIIQNPFVDGAAAAEAAVRSSGRVIVWRLAWFALRDELRRRRGGARIRVDLAGHPGSLAMIATPDAVEGFASILSEEAVGFEPRVPARIMLQLRSDSPARYAEQVSCPLLVCVCDDDTIAPPEPAIGVAERAPRGD